VGAYAAFLLPFLFGILGKCIMGGLETTVFHHVIKGAFEFLLHCGDLG
jgi:hypothetical protein